MARHTRSRALTRRNSRANTSTGPSRAASATICRRKRRRPSHKRSSTLRETDSLNAPLSQRIRTGEFIMAFTIKVNGNTHDVDVDDDTPLFWVLRDVLGLTGTKFGCGMALCGACTVHVDDAPTRSCITPIDSIGNSEIKTI